MFHLRQDLRTCDKFSRVWKISRGLRPREIFQLRKSYVCWRGDRLQLMKRDLQNR